MLPVFRTWFSSHSPCTFMGHDIVSMSSFLASVSYQWLLLFTIVAYEQCNHHCHYHLYDDKIPVHLKCARHSANHCMGIIPNNSFSKSGLSTVLRAKYHNYPDCSLSGSSVRGIFQTRTLEWVAIPFSIPYS